VDATTRRIERRRMGAQTIEPFKDTASRATGPERLSGQALGSRTGRDSSVGRAHD
jgi:hypothetical protein